MAVNLPSPQLTSKVSDNASDEHTDGEGSKMAPYEFKRVTFNMQQFKDTLRLVLSPTTKEGASVRSY